MAQNSSSHEQSIPSEQLAIFPQAGTSRNLNVLLFQHIAHGRSAPRTLETIDEPKVNTPLHNHSARGNQMASGRSYWLGGTKAKLIESRVKAGVP